MTATDRLRALLDERGVEWKDSGEGLTIIPAQDGVLQAWTVNTWPSGKNMGDCLWVQNRIPLTPEQAVEVTLGRGECHMTSGSFNEFDYCSECGGLLARWIDYRATTGYCPNCGRKVVE